MSDADDTARASNGVAVRAADGDVTLLSLTAFNAEPAGMLVLASMECCALVL